MAIVDAGCGPALVLIPGIQGRWEWMRPTVDALSTRWRVITRSLPGEPGARPFDPAAGFDQFVAHVDELFDRAGLDAAVLCGISFGGLVALRYAAQRPHRVRALILVSTPGPRWRPAAAQQRYMARPLLMFPAFVCGAARRAAAELRATFPNVRDRFEFVRSYAWQVMRAPGVPRRMASRAKLAAAEDFSGDCARVAAPTLIVAGEPSLDRVVKIEDAREYARCIGGAQLQVLARTGHLGAASAAGRFGEMIAAFLDRAGQQ